MNYDETTWIVYGYTEATHTIMEVPVLERHRKRHTALVLVPPMFGDGGIPCLVHEEQMHPSREAAEAWCMRNPPRPGTPK